MPTQRTPAPHRTAPRFSRSARRQPQRSGVQKAIASLTGALPGMGSSSKKSHASSGARSRGGKAGGIALGIFEMAAAFALPLIGGRSLLLALSGMLSVAFGVIMFAHPGAGAVALLALIAAFALVTGVMQVAFAIELRRVVVELDHRVRPHGTASPVTHG